MENSRIKLPAVINHIKGANDTNETPVPHRPGKVREFM
jgi:hypothetical protein